MPPVTPTTTRKNKVDKDLKRISALERATLLVAQPYVGIGLSLLFLLTILALTTSDLTVLKEMPGKASRSVYGLLENPNRFLGAVRIAGFIFSVGIVVCCVWFLGFFIDIIES